MKKTLLIITCLLFCFKAYTQSLTFKDLLYLKKQPTAKDFLTAKGFIHSDLNADIMEVYFKNEGTDRQEKAEFNLHKNKAYVSYSSTDTTYIRTIITQLYKQYRLILKDQSARETYYRFGDLNINIIVDVYKSPPPNGRITVGPLD